jgi:CII-binding regulator of phage lambda lysogenization HflD
LGLVFTCIETCAALFLNLNVFEQDSFMKATKVWSQEISYQHFAMENTFFRTCIKLSQKIIKKQKQINIITMKLNEKPHRKTKYIQKIENNVSKVESIFNNIIQRLQTRDTEDSFVY